MSGEAVLLDGALGTELERRGVATPAPLWSVHGLLKAPQLVTEIHRDFVRAGARVLTACTFRTHERSLRGGGQGGHGRALNALAVRCAREGAGAVEGVRVAGSIAPLEDCFRPDRVPDAASLRREHGEQAKSLAEAGADLLLVETMGTRREASAAVTAAVATGLPTWCSFITKSPGRLLSGEPLREAVAAAEDLGAEIVLINCIPAREARADVEALAACAGLPFGCYPGLGHERGGAGARADLEATPEDFAELVLELRDLGADVLGGCCGTRPEHLAALAAGLA